MDQKNDKPLKPADEYRGATVNEADKNKINVDLIKQDTKILNSNPHSKGL